MTLQITIFSVFLLLSVADAFNRLVAFQFIEDSVVCRNGEEEAWNIRLDSFHVDCGNANHGCIPGQGIMIYGEFEALSSFYSVAEEVDIGACVFGGMACKPNILETQLNLCEDLALWDVDGYQTCNQPGNYTFESSWMLPNHTWWEDFAFNGLMFNVFVTFEDDLTCYGKFVTHVYHNNETWMAFAVGSVALVLGAYYYVRRKRRQQGGKIDLIVEEAATEDEAATEAETEKAPAKKGKKKATKPSLAQAPTDDESVTSTSYLRMLDFSPEGLSHADRMEQVRQAHFDRLRKARESRKPSSCKGLLP